MNDAKAAIVKLVDASKTYDGVRPVHALNSVHLTIEPSDYIAIVGPSGSGKSTLLNIVGLLDELTTGEYHFNGSSTAQMGERARCGIRAFSIGFVFQSFHLVSYRSALENVEDGLLYQGVTRAERRHRSELLLEQVGLAPRMFALPSELSGGERQRVAIARALVRRPSLVLCDEPTGNLDSASGERVMSLLAQLNEEGQTIAVITHDVEVARRARRVVEIRDGRVFEETSGSTNE